MIKKVVLFVFFILTTPTFSQADKGSEITAEGSSRFRIKPDLANFRISIDKRDLTEKTAIKELNEEIEKLQKALFKIGFTEKNIKISDYKISSDQNNDDKKEYSVTNSLSIDFPLDNKLIEAFYQEIQNVGVKDLDVEFETHLSEDLEKTSRQRLVQIAIADAKSNAENIAKALDVKIINIKQVSKYMMENPALYSIKSGRVKFEASPAGAPNPKTAFDRFEVEEKELEETISIVFGIEKK
jgi:uncharacterized protein YggE